MDGRRVPIPRTADEYAVAFDSDGRTLNHATVQRYMADPAAWLRDRRCDVARVAVYPVQRRTWDGREVPVILWSEQPVEIEV